eukprot:gene13772-19680_t
MFADSRQDWREAVEESQAAYRHLLATGTCLLQAPACSRRLLATGTCLLQAPACSRRLLAAGTCLLQAPACSRRLLATGTCLLQAPACSRRLLATGTCLLQAPACYRHQLATGTCLLQAPACYRHLLATGTSLLQAPACYRHLLAQGACLLQAPACSRRLLATCTCLLQAPACSRRLLATCTCLLQAPACYRHLLAHIAVFAEFRQDWREAVEEYQAAYSHLAALVVVKPLPLHKWFEVCKVSELILLKLLMLMLHQGRMEDAVNLAQSHLATFISPPEPLPPAAHVSHLGFVVRQHLVVSEVLCSKLEVAAAAGQPVPPQAKLLSRAMLMMSAAQAAASRRKAFDTLTAERAASEAAPPTFTNNRTHPLPVQMSAAQAAVSRRRTFVALKAERAASEAAPPTFTNSRTHPLPVQMSAAQSAVSRRRTFVALKAERAVSEATPPTFTNNRTHPLPVQMSAAQAAVSRRKAFDALKAERSVSGAAPPTFDPNAVKRVPYVGQMRLKTAEGLRELSDTEYLQFLEAEEGGRVGGPVPGPAGVLPSPSSRANPGVAAACLEVLSAALVVLKDTQNERMRSRLGLLMAEEHMVAGNLSAARKLLLQICHAYRRDGWDMPLVQVLSQMREVSGRLQLASELIVYSLELSCIPLAEAAVLGGPAARLEVVRQALALLMAGKPTSGVAAGTKGGPSASPSAFEYSVEYINLKEEQRRAREAGDAHSTVAELLLQHHQQDYGWLRCITASVGTTHPDPNSSHVDCCVALKNQLPLPLPLTSVSFTLTDDAGSWEVVARPGGKLPEGYPAFHPAPALVSIPGAEGTSDATCDPSRVATDAVTSSLSALELSAASGRANGQLHVTPGVAEGAGPLLLEPGLWSTAAIRVAPRGGRAGGAGPLLIEPGLWSTAAIRVAPRGGRAGGAGPLLIEPGLWSTAAIRVAPRCVGRLQVEYVTLAVGDHARIRFKVSSFPLPSTLLGCSQFADVELPPLGKLGASPGQHHVMIPHLGRLPVLKVLAPQQALVGEHAPVRVCITVTWPLSGAILDAAVKSKGISPDDITLTVVDDVEAAYPWDPSQRTAIVSSGCTLMGHTASKPQGTWGGHESTRRRNQHRSSNTSLQATTSSSLKSRRKGRRSRPQPPQGGARPQRAQTRKQRGRSRSRRPLIFSVIRFLLSLHPQSRIIIFYQGPSAEGRSRPATAAAGCAAEAAGPAAEGSRRSRSRSRRSRRLSSAAAGGRAEGRSR